MARDWRTTSGATEPPRDQPRRRRVWAKRRITGIKGLKAVGGGTDVDGRVGDGGGFESDLI
jgi:hypothetical protein